MHQNQLAAWFDLLGLNGFDEIQHIKELKQPKVAIIHFQESSYSLSSNIDNNIAFNGIDFTVRSWEPTATKAMIEKSLFIDKEVLTIENYNLYNFDLIDQKRKRTPSVSSLPASVISPDFKQPRKRRGVIEPYHESFIGSSDLIISLMRDMNIHGQRCKGNLNFRRNNVHMRRFTLCVQGSCSLQNGCSYFNRGIVKWQSVANIDISNEKSVPVTDVLYSTAICMTPNTMGHIEQFVSAMLFTPPDRHLLKEIIVTTVDPYLKKKKENLIKDKCSELKDIPLKICLDTGYNSSRNAQGATLVVASGNKVIASFTDTKSNAWLKEGLLVDKALDFLINEKSLDVCIVDIDDNASNGKKIKSYKRINGPPGYEEETVEIGNLRCIYIFVHSYV